MFFVQTRKKLTQSLLDLQKYLLNNAFFANFLRYLLKYSQNYPTICVFSPNARKINAWFVNFFEKWAKIIHFLQFFQEIFLQIFDTFPPSGGLRPDALTPPRIFFAAYATGQLTTLTNKFNFGEESQVNDLSPQNVR